MHAIGARIRSGLSSIFPERLKLPHRRGIVGCCRIGRAFEPGGEPLATVNVAALRVWVELARSHILEHTLTQRTGSVSPAHGELHPE
jgi:hypothetical protein